MADREYAPLSTACVRALMDRVYEKRKAAALEIEKMVKDFVAVKNVPQLKRLLKVLGTDFAISQNPLMRKGGLIGLAAMAIGLGKESGDYAEDLIMPVLSCLTDADSRVRYYACESLYNVVKVLRENIMPYFNEIFGSISVLVADPDQGVKNGSELLDRLLKDIVTENKKFDIENFIPVLRERMYTKDRFVRQYLVSWLSVLDSVPDSQLVKYLPEFLDPLFYILDDSSDEISTMCENQLGEFLANTIKSPEKCDFPGMINILIVHSQSTNVLLQMMAITWMKEFVELAGLEMLPYTSGILNSILPCLAYDTQERSTVREMSKGVNEGLMKLIAKTCSGEEEGKERLDLTNVIDVLTKQLQRGVQQSKVASLKWIYHLFQQMPKEMIERIDTLAPVLLKTLSDHSDEVVILDLEVLAEVCSSTHARVQEVSSTAEAVKAEEAEADPQPASSSSDDKTATKPVEVRFVSDTSVHFRQFMTSLLKLFSADKNLLETKGSFIIRQLCVLLRPDDIYMSFSELLVGEKNLKFARQMVEILSTILLTSSELYELRYSLKKLPTKDSCHLFCCLYQTWCHSQVATLSLCLLAGCYNHASALVRIIAEQEVTVEMLIELDRLVQLLESPIFTFLRIELLDGDPDLVNTMYAILMLLPQSEPFRLINNRLACVSHMDRVGRPKHAGSSSLNLKDIDFPFLTEHFKEVGSKHQLARRREKAHKFLAKIQ